MTREQIVNGLKIIRALDNINHAITECETAIKKVEEEEATRNPQASDFAGGFHAVLGNYKDKSGFNVDMTGCFVQLDMYKACLEVLNKKKEYFEAELEKI